MRQIRLKYGGVAAAVAGEGGVKAALDGKADASSVPHASTDLSDGSDLVRNNDTVTINGGGV